MALFLRQCGYLATVALSRLPRSSPRVGISSHYLRSFRGRNSLCPRPEVRLQSALFRYLLVVSVGTSDDADFSANIAPTR